MSFVIDNNENSQLSVSSPSQQKYKIVFLGDQGVGKTSIINKFIFDIFDDQSNPTIGIDFISKSIHINQKIVRFQLWDTAGQERFRSLIPNYLRDAQVALLVYDVSNQQSLDSIELWFNQVLQERDECIIMLIGNKSDLEQNTNGRKFAEKFGIEFMEVSAKTGEGVTQVFQKVAELIGEKNPSLDEQREKFIKTSSKYIVIEKQSKERRCC